jgi:hypothetical protein
MFMSCVQEQNITKKSHGVLQFLDGNFCGQNSRLSKSWLISYNIKASENVLRYFIELVGN